jgi:hypothetical protein
VQVCRIEALACDLPPCLIPYIYPTDEDWLPRYHQYNQPGEYHNGGIWPFVEGFISLLWSPRVDTIWRAEVQRSQSQSNQPARALLFGFNDGTALRMVNPRAGLANLDGCHVPVCGGLRGNTQNAISPVCLIWSNSKTYNLWVYKVKICPE